MDNFDYSESFGYLVITARSASEGFPVEGARITISEGEERGDSAAVAVTITDASGRSERIRLRTPPAYLSESPGAKAPPFASYNVVTEKEGYYSVTNVGVPIYPGVVSLQPIAMVPLEYSEGELLYPSDTERFTETTPPNL